MSRFRLKLIDDAHKSMFDFKGNEPEELLHRMKRAMKDKKL